MKKKHYFYVMIFFLCIESRLAFSIEFQPGAGVGIRYTDNAELAAENAVSDIITTVSVGASIAENEGPFVFDANASLRREKYINDTFGDERYFNLGASANWELLRERLDLYLIENFNQRSVNSLDPDTPGNRQNSNTFILGANLSLPISGRQTFLLVPQYSQYYYELDNTNNRQYSLAASWNYQMFRLTNVGLNLSTRTIKYDDRSISDTTFTNFGFIVSGLRAHLNYAVNLGVTNVKRDAAEAPDRSANSSEDSGLVGSVNLQAELSSRSAIQALVLTEITDTSNVSQNTSPGNPNDVELVTDIIRNSIARLTYSRIDATLQTNIWGEFRKIKYSDNTSLNSLIQTVGAKLDFPITQLVSGGVFVNFGNTKRSDSVPVRDDKDFNVGVNVDVTFTSKLSSVFDVRYRTKESTDSISNYDEFSFFASLNYGFGRVSRGGR